MIIGMIIGISLIVGLLWVNGIDQMNEKYPDYKGEDFLEIHGEEPWKI